MGDTRNLVSFKRTPDVERQQPTGAKNPCKLGQRVCLIRKEHQPELTNDGVKFLVAVR